MTVDHLPDTDVPAFECVTPSDRITIVCGDIPVLCRWDGTDVHMDLPSDLFALSPDGIGVPHDAGYRLAQALTFAHPAAHQLFLDWRAWTGHPGRFGAVPSTYTTRLEGQHLRSARWHAPNVQVNTSGTPYLDFSADCTWTVRMTDWPHALATAAWNDLDAIAVLCERLTDETVWHVQAALEHPQDWSRLTERQEKARLRAEAVEAQRLQDAALAESAATVTQVVTRRVTQTLRSTTDTWHTPDAMPGYKDVIVEHCDVRTATATLRVAERLTIPWLPNVTRKTRLATVDRLEEVLAPAGYHAVLSKSGFVLVGSDREFLRKHYAAIARTRRSGSRTLTV